MTKPHFSLSSAVAHFASQRFISSVAVALVTVAAFVRGLGAQIDQENWSEKTEMTYATGQQEFTPSLNTLDSVQLFSFGGNYWGGGSFTIDIRQGGVNGEILAASEPSYIAPYYEGPVGFGFAKPVQLVPGNVYALEYIGEHQVFSTPFGTTPADYPGGRFFGSGQFVDRDLIFREGISLELVPEPSLVQLLGGGLGFILAYHLCAYGSLNGNGRMKKV